MLAGVPVCGRFVSGTEVLSGPTAVKSSPVRHLIPALSLALVSRWRYPAPPWLGYREDARSVGNRSMATAGADRQAYSPLPGQTTDAQAYCALTGGWSSPCWPLHGQQRRPGGAQPDRYLVHRSDLDPSAGCHRIDPLDRARLHHAAWRRRAPAVVNHRGPGVRRTTGASSGPGDMDCPLAVAAMTSLALHRARLWRYAAAVSVSSSSTA